MTLACAEQPEFVRYLEVRQGRSRTDVVNVLGTAQVKVAVLWAARSGSRRAKLPGGSTLGAVGSISFHFAFAVGVACPRSIASAKLMLCQGAYSIQSRNFKTAFADVTGHPHHPHHPHHASQLLSWSPASALQLRFCDGMRGQNGISIRRGCES
jgi:hypothetical protein